MKSAIMQPYFLPYIGYFQLINAVDIFVIYDNIQYTKKGWINRNRFLQNGMAAGFTVPLKKDSDFLDVQDRTISSGFDKGKILNQFREVYRKAPNFDQIFPLFRNIIMYDENNLFHYIYFSIIEICNALKIKTKLVRSSNIMIDHTLKAEEKVMAICKNLNSNIYINAIGGQELYSKKEFESQGIQLEFIQTNPIIYKQFDNEFVPWLSIIDVMMFNKLEEIDKMINDYKLV